MASGPIVLLDLVVGGTTLDVIMLKQIIQVSEYESTNDRRKWRNDFHTCILSSAQMGWGALSLAYMQICSPNVSTVYICHRHSPCQYNVPIFCSVQDLYQDFQRLQIAAGRLQRVWDHSFCSMTISTVFSSLFHQLSQLLSSSCFKFPSVEMYG